ncbi:RHS repeat-associated core domain-containing protein [Paraburkholderia susongensis]|uniref:RHS repeat-associated core domain-containing protein n=1 Tax=Paraburkholderia susongensis TaxID=1515439 RepID=A0A1X7LLT9_9BURK|nr:RHS repeat-associated core domain-containing protein [Paraburkholderia susongensis]SMG54202.1 RHS repeat-associated core domain-containing protein [Paraburkholderia susongensis]
METGIAGIGGELVKLPGVVLPLASGGPPADRYRRPGDVVDRYRLRRALSGVLCRSVDVITGSKVCLPADEADFTLRGRFPLEWSRYYSSARVEVGLLGAGWRTRWEITLHKIDSRLVYADEYGSTLSVPFPERGTQVIAPSAQLHFAHLPDGRIVVADLTPHYRVFGDFDANGIARLKYIEDLHRQRVGCIWDAEGRLLRMRGTCGHELRMHYETRMGARLAAIECVDGGPGGALVQYGYSPNGELTEVRNRIGAIVRRFAWRDGQIVEEAGPLGMATRYAWQTIGGVARVVERATSEGARDRLTYDIDSRVSQVTDVFGHAANWQYDEHGHVRSHTDFDGRRYRFDYRDSAAPTAVWLPGERVVRLEYDALGRVVQETDPQGTTRVTEYAFASREPASVTLSDGRTWTWARNERLQPVHVQTPAGEITRFEYGADGCVARSTDAQGVATTYAHDAWGQLIRRTAADGGTTHYERDVNGYVVRVTDALGAVTLFERNGLGWPLNVTRPDGQVERHVWNAAGQRTSFVGPSGHSRHWYRDRRGNVVRAVDEEGHVIVRQYDAHGRPVRIESANGAIQMLEWGARDCLSITDADGVTRSFVYTGAGQIHSVTSKAGAHTRSETFAYDAAGRPVERETQHNRYVYRYAVRGGLEAISRTPTSEGELLGIGADEIRFEHDAGGRLIAEHGANGELRYTYNATGRLVATRLPQGQELRTRRLETGEIALVEVDEREVARFWYDAMRRPVARTQGRLRTHTGYSPLGQPIWWRSVTSDELSAPATPSESDMQLWREVDYSPADLLVRIGGPAAGQTWYDYDRRGCLLRRVSEQLGIEYFTWDAASNLLDTPGGNWFPAVYADHRIRECRGYRYEYDAWGQLVRRSGRDHTLSLEWDAEGRVIAAHRKGHTVRYQYDALGRRVAKRVEASSPQRSQTPEQDELTRYLWQGHRLVQEQRPGALRTYLYQPEPPGSTGFAPLACVDQTLADDGSIKGTQIRHYHTDGAGTAIALTDEIGKVVWHGRYRAWGDPVTQEWGRSDTVAQPLRYAGQYADEETALHYNGTRLYDPDAGRYISSDRTGDGGISPYCYAPNPLTWCNPLGRAKPERLPYLVGVEASDNHGVPDPAQQIAGLVEQFDDVPGWDPLEG